MALDSVLLESFSFRWLISIKDDSTATAASFIDIDPNLISFRWTVREDVQGSLKKLESSHLATSGAEEYFSDGVVWNGLLMNPPPPPPPTSTENLVGRSGSLGSTKVLLSLSQRHEFIAAQAMEEVSLPKRRRKFFQTEIAKYLCFAVPLFKQVKGLMRKITRSRAERRRPRRTAVVAIDDEELEKSINEAVLHCKKSRASA